MNIVLGVSGGIAAYKVVGLARLFAEAGHEVHVIPTEHALSFIGAVTWEAISGNPVPALDDGSGVPHVQLGQDTDLIVVAPATANTIARFATGLADDMLGATVLASRAPILIAPAMHTEMWEHPATQHNIATLRERGVAVVGPESGRLTGRDSGPGRMSEPEAIFDEAMRILGSDSRSGSGSGSSSSPGDLSGLRLLISAGGTREPIDPVRFIGNRSSGRQGVAIARAAAERGASVELVAANIDASVLSVADGHPSIRVTAVRSTAELQESLESSAGEADVIVMAAAVADYRPKAIAEGKIRKAERKGVPPRIELVENPDILVGLVGSRRPGQTLVGFAAETEEDEDRLLKLGREKLRRKGVDLLAVNAVGWSAGFESEENAVIVLNAAGEVAARAAGTKGEVADALLDAVAAQRYDDSA